MIFVPKDPFRPFNWGPRKSADFWGEWGPQRALLEWGVRAEAMVVLSFIRAPAEFNLWEEEETQPLHLLQGNLIMDCRFRRSGAVSSFAIHLPNAIVSYSLYIIYSFLIH